MPTNHRALALSLVFFFMAGPLVRAADVLQAIPDTALAVVVINRLEDTSDKIERVARQLHAPEHSLLTLFRVQTGIHEGLDEKGTAALIVLPAKDGGAMPQIALLLPVTDYQKFLTQLQPDDPTKQLAEVRLAGRSVLVCKQGDFAALAMADAKGVLEDILGSVKDIRSDLSPLRTWLGEIDAGAVATSAGIKLAVAQAQQNLPMLRLGVQGIAQQQPGQLQSIGELLNLAERGLKSFETEVTHLAYGVKVDDSLNLHLASRVRFASGGDWSTSAKGIKAPKEGVLAGLPGDPFAAAFGILMPKSLREAFGSEIANLVKVNPMFAQLPADQQTRLAKATVDMIGSIDSVAATYGVPQPGAPVYSRVAMVLKVEDAPKYLEQYGESIKLFSDLPKNPQVPAITYDVQKIDVDGTAALDIVTDVSGFNQPGGAAVKAVFEKMFGASDKIHLYVAAVDDKTAVMAYVSLDNLKRTIAGVKAAGGGLAADPQIAETTTLLPKGAQWLGYVHPQSIQTLIQAVLATAPAAANPPAADSQSSPPIGLAGKISASGLNVDIVVPAATLPAVGQLVFKGLQQ